MKNDLLNPTPSQIKSRNRKWAEALLLNKRKARNRMKDGDGGRCCLDVAQDLAMSCGIKIDKAERSDYLPTDSVRRFFGWPSDNPYLILPNKEKAGASEINDGKVALAKFTENKQFQATGLPHSKIAECVLNTFVHPTKQKWTFKL